MSNPGPASSTTVNVTEPVGNLKFIEAIQVNVGTVAGILTVTATEITFSGLGTGLKAGDVILSVSKPTAQAGLGIAGWRNDPATDDKFYITYVNPTAGTVTPTASEVYTLTVARMTQSNTGLTAVV